MQNILNVRPAKWLGLSLLLSSLMACGGSDSSTIAVEPEETKGVTVALSTPTGSDTLEIGTWNIEWFGSSQGPSNDALQLQNVETVIESADFDILGVQEIVSTSQFNTLLNRLSGYDGIIANDSLVQGGSGSYSNDEQKVGLIYKNSVATLLSAKVILANQDYVFAGRPPVEFKLQVGSETLMVIVMHAKAGSASNSYNRREDAAAALKSYLDSTYPNDKVWVVGDFNDDVDQSITNGRVSSYQIFLDDPTDYAFPTKTLSEAGIASTVSYPDIVDHHLVTNEVYATYIPGSVQAIQPNIANYGSTTSDHYPIISSYSLGAGITPTPVPTPVSTPTPGNGCQNVAFTLKTDQYGSETSWTLKQGSTTVEAGSGYGNNQTINQTFCLDSGTYTFTINDSYGDGICCSYGNGSYSLVLGNTTLASGGSFTSSDTKTFTIGSGGTNPTPTPTANPGGPVTLLSQSGSVNQGSWRNYTITVPTGQSRLNITMTGSGDADLYVKRKFSSRDYPTTSNYEFRPYLNGSNETVTISNSTNPRLQAGEYWISVNGYTNANFNITATVE